MPNGHLETGSGYIPIVGKEAASDPNAVYITANEPEEKPKRANRRCTKAFYLKFNSIEQERLVGGGWVPIPRGQVQPFNFPRGLPGIDNPEPERVEACCFYYLYIEPNDAYRGPEEVRAVVTFTVSDIDGLNATTGRYVHQLPSYPAS